MTLIEDMTVAVLPGTGKTGRRIAQRLRDAGAAVRAGSRRRTPPSDRTNQATWRDHIGGQKNAQLPGRPSTFRSTSAARGSRCRTAAEHVSRANVPSAHAEAVLEQRHGFAAHRGALGHRAPEDQLQARAAQLTNERGRQGVAFA